MPSRQLPRTDAERLQALQAASDKAAAVPAAHLAFSAATKTVLDATLPQFRTEVEQRGTALAGQTQATAAQIAQAARLQMWLSHFLRNLNFAIDRGLILASARAFYQIDVSQESLPNTSTEADLVLWAGRAVSGEASRIAAGGAALPFPPIAEVSAELNSYQSLRAQQSSKKDTFDAEAEDVEALRPPVDALILDIWDEVEFTFRHESASSLRAKAREYGVIYVSRPGEPPEPGTPLPAPTGLVLNPQPDGTILANWAGAPGATGYRVEVLVVGVDPAFHLLASVTDSDATLSGLPAGATVQVRVIAVNADGDASPPSDVVEVLVPVAPVTP